MTESRLHIAWLLSDTASLALPARVTYRIRQFVTRLASPSCSPQQEGAGTPNGSPLNRPRYTSKIWMRSYTFDGISHRHQAPGTGTVVTLEY